MHDYHKWTALFIWGRACLLGKADAVFDPASGGANNPVNSVDPV